MFLKKLGAGILSVSSLEHVKAENKLDEPTFSNSTSDPIPRNFLNAPTEVSESKFYPAPESPNRRMGYAIVGLGHLALSVAKNKKPYTPGEEGLQDQKIIDAIYKSAHENTLVKLEKYTTLDTFRGDKPTEDE